MEALSLSLIAAAVVATVGMIEWAKGFAPLAPSWVWRVVMPILAVGWGFVIGGEWISRAVYAGLVIALAETGYQLVVKKLGEVVARLVDKLG